MEQLATQPKPETAQASVSTDQAENEEMTVTGINQVYIRCSVIGVLVLYAAHKLQDMSLKVSLAQLATAVRGERSPKSDGSWETGFLSALDCTPVLDIEYVSRQKFSVNWCKSHSSKSFEEVLREKNYFTNKRRFPDEANAHEVIRARLAKVDEWIAGLTEGK